MKFEHIRASRWLVAPLCSQGVECEESHRIVKEPGGAVQRFHGQDVAVPLEGPELASFIEELGALMDKHGVVYVEAGEE